MPHGLLGSWAMAFTYWSARDADPRRGRAGFPVVFQVKERMFAVSHSPCSGFLGHWVGGEAVRNSGQRADPSCPNQPVTSEGMAGAKIWALEGQSLVWDQAMSC